MIHRPAARSARLNAQRLSALRLSAMWFSVLRLKRPDYSLPAMFASKFGIRPVSQFRLQRHAAQRPAAQRLVVQLPAVYLPM